MNPWDVLGWMLVALAGTLLLVLVVGTISGLRAKKKATDEFTSLAQELRKLGKPQ